MDDTENSGADWGRGGERAGDVGPLLTGMAVGAVLVGLVWWVVAVVAPGPDQPGSGQAGDSEVGAALVTPSATPTAALSALDRCTDAAYALTMPLGEAQPALDQWAIHVGAMNKLVVGEITLAQATAFWDQTRVGAHRRIRSFDRAARQVARSGVDCPAPHLLGTRASDQLRACSAQVAAGARTYAAARTAITTWRHHVHDMDQLRLGKLAPAAATQMWLSMWERGVDELDAYRVAAKTERRTDGCAGDVGVAAPSALPSASPSATHSMSSMH